eukprot:Gregarina_sp_Poly_1__9471@NODE_594_length_7275_cov_67_691593_g459_i0_p3_GENE_NODE_594_length_7275_cov_67_691593_g459_i0NODE_594_length_7275_cov_67_691593_g459_i0_p3_ORF_typecomplete_len445_score35_88CDPOH_P_transf/PF01066_21/1_6e16CDPOH_P_transf/PF01066_21/4_5e03_NODE_594_length_7275_cov_67_691593_g459_i01821516
MASMVSSLPERFLASLRTPYINETDCKVLSEYKYHSNAGTKLDGLLNKYWWTPLARFIPLDIHPNTLTVAGLVASYVLSFLPLVIFNPTFDKPCPRWVYLVAALGFFTYQTLDALDGKQARRTKLSSPMGQMMDHGCDSLTTFLSLFICCSTCQLGAGPLISTQLALITTQLYFYSWYECTFGIFRACTGDYFGVTEGQWLIIIVNLVAFYNPQLWLQSLSQIFPGFLGTVLGLMTLNMSLATVTYILGNAILVYVAYSDFKEILTTRRPPNVSKAIKEWCQIGLHVYCNVALVLGGVIKRQPQLSTSLITISGSLVAWRFIMTCVSKAELRLIQWPSIPFYVVSILTSCKAFGPMSEFVILMLTTAWMCIALFTFVQVNMTLIKEYLGLNLFVVPASQNQAAKKSVSADDFVSPSARTEAPSCHDSQGDAVERRPSVPISPSD